MTKNQNSLGIGHQKLGISTEKGMGRITRQGNAQKVKREPVDQFVGAGNLKSLLRLSFSSFSSGSSSLVSFQLPTRDFLTPLQLSEMYGLGFWKLGFGIWDPRLRIWMFSSSVRTSQPASVPSCTRRAFRCVCIPLFQLRLLHLSLSDGA